MSRDKFRCERVGDRRSRPSRSRTRSRTRTRSKSRSRRPTRTRSRSRRPIRSRSRRPRTHSRSRTRSVCKESRAGNGNDPLDLTTFKDLIAEQQEYITSLISSQKKEIEDKFQTNSNFCNKGNRKQYEFNSQILSLLKSAKSFLKDKESDKALELMRNTIDQIEEQNQNIHIADSSKFGWLTVFKLRGTENLSSSIKKKVDKIESTLERNNAKSSNYKKPGGFGFKRKFGKPGVQTERSFEKKGPEETLQWLKTRKRHGICTHCTESGHFWRECPQYWASVNKARTQDN